MKTAVFICMSCIALGLFPFFSCSRAVPPASRVILGDEQFDLYLPLLAESRVALFTNHTGIVGDKIILAGGSVRHGGFLMAEGRDASLIPFGYDDKDKSYGYGDHILDALIDRGIDVRAVFSPEHGFRGNEDAGAAVQGGVDEKTGVPILSLYESPATHAPSKASMAAFDTLVVDMQDIGLRYYTYYIALYYLMDACAKNGKRVLVLDRPNPNGFYVDGGILEDAYRSGVGQLPLPVVHGMTWGELARMMNGEGWLSAGRNSCDLTVIPLKNYTHQTRYALIRPPSPNIKDMRAVYLYASTCFFENTIVSVGRGTSFPFEVYGSPYFRGLGENVFSFVPESLPGASNPPFLGDSCYGKDLRSLPLSSIWDEKINLSYLVQAWQDAKKSLPADKTEADVSAWFWGRFSSGRYWIDLLSGSDFLRTQIEAGKTAAQIKESWQPGLEAFEKARKPYLLYAE